MLLRLLLHCIYDAYLLAHMHLQHRASIQFPNAHSDGIWSTFWAANDKILTGSVDEVAKAWCVVRSLSSSASCSLRMRLHSLTHVCVSLTIVSNPDA